MFFERSIMSLRQTINENPAATTVGAVLLVAMACVVLLWSLVFNAAANGAQAAYWYNQDTGQVFVEPANDASEDGRYSKDKKIKAMIYACGQCDDSYAGMTAVEIEKAGARLVYLLRSVTSERRGGQTITRELVGQPGRDQWVPAGQPKSYPMMKYPGDCDGGRQVRQCRPDA
jgi:hypothetical protein